MKKFLIALLCLFPMSAVHALDVDFVSDLTLANDGWTIGMDQDNDELSVTAGGVTLLTSDVSQIGLVYGMTISGITGSASYDYTSDDEHELGFDTSISLAGINVDAGLDWNIDDSSFDASLGSGYSAFGLDGAATTYWDIDDFGFDGMDIDAGYSWSVTDQVTVRPNVTIPFDEDWARGDLTAGFSVSSSFGGSSTE